MRCIAPSKLTRTLRIVGRRDDGFHLIDSEMMTVSLADDLVIDPIGDHGGESDGDSGGSRLEIVPAATGLAVTADADNSVIRALALAGRRADVRLVKRIPAGAGLGGGSADAAAILRWAGFTDVMAASTLGADVAFCLYGGRARVTGIGEIIEPLDDVALSFTLLVPPLGCSTPEVYAAWDAMGGPRGEGANDLEPAALLVAPELAKWRDRLADATGQTPTLAGSGSTWFVEGAFPGDDRIVVETVPRFVIGT